MEAIAVREGRNVADSNVWVFLDVKESMNTLICGSFGDIFDITP